MTPKEKAIELAIEFCNEIDIVKPNKSSIKKAIICVDELMKIIPKTKDWSPETKLYMELMGDDPYDFDLLDSDEYKFYQEVKQELEKL